MRRPALAACSLVLVLGMSACGGSGADKKPTAPNPLAAAADRTAGAGTAKIASVERGSLGGLTYMHRRSGVVDFRDGYVSITKRSTIGGEAQPPSRHVELDGYFYDQVGGQWVKEKEGGGKASAAGDATRIIDYLQGWSSGVAVAHRGSGGVLYRGKLDLQAAIEDDLHRHGWTDSAIETFAGPAANAPPASVEAAVGRDGLIHHVVVRGGVNGETMTLDLSQFGVHVDAAPPS